MVRLRDRRPPRDHPWRGAVRRRGPGAGRAEGERCGAQLCGTPASFPFGQPAIRTAESGHRGGRHTALQVLSHAGISPDSPGWTSQRVRLHRGGADGLEQREVQKENRIQARTSVSVLDTWDMPTYTRILIFGLRRGPFLKQPGPPLPMTYIAHSSGVDTLC